MVGVLNLFFCWVVFLVCFSLVKIRVNGVIEYFFIVWSLVNRLGNGNLGSDLWIIVIGGMID